MSPKPKDSTGLWLSSWKQVDWVFWTTYLFLPPLVTVFLSPAEHWSRPDRLVSDYLCNLIGTVCVAGLAHVLYTAATWRLRFRHEPIRILTHALIALTAVVVGTELSLLIEVHRHPDWGVDAMRLVGYHHAFPVAGVLALGLLLLDRVLARASGLEVERARAERDALAARLQVLQTRTDPHFLFNTLNTIAELVHEDPHRAEFVVERLSSVFRHTMEKSETTLVELHEELEVVTDYLSIEEARFGDDLHWEITCSDSLRRALVPALSFQPLVENAIKHGRRASGDVAVSVAVDVVSGCLRVRILDDGPGPGGSTHRGTRTSLKNLRERLTLLYDDDATLDVSPRAEGGTCVTLRFPLEHR